MRGEIAPAITSIEVDASKVDPQRVDAILQRIAKALEHPERPTGTAPETPAS
jgi:hypothetical protein